MNPLSPEARRANRSPVATLAVAEEAPSIHTGLDVVIALLVAVLIAVATAVVGAIRRRPSP